MFCITQMLKNVNHSYLTPPVPRCPRNPKDGFCPLDSAVVQSERRPPKLAGARRKSAAEATRERNGVACFLPPQRFGTRLVEPPRSWRVLCRGRCIWETVTVHSLPALYRISGNCRWMFSVDMLCTSLSLLFVSQFRIPALASRHLFVDGHVMCRSGGAIFCCINICLVIPFRCV